MNYFSHGFCFLDDPYFLAGTAVPDWLNVVNRKAKIPSKIAGQFVEHQNPVVARVARGIVQHHQDDAWFHRTRAFAELCWEFTVLIRDQLSPDQGMRPSFLAHVLVELILDDCLIQRHPRRLDAYYKRLASLPATELADAILTMSRKPLQKLDAFIELFLQDQFLYDYADDHRLTWRLNRVLQRVGLTELPEDFLDILPTVRRRVQQRTDELLQAD